MRDIVFVAVVLGSQMSPNMSLLASVMSRFSTAFTHRSTKEAGPHHLGDGRVLGAAAVAGHRHLCRLRFSSWSVQFHQYIVITFESNVHPSHSTLGLACVKLCGLEQAIKISNNNNTKCSAASEAVLMMERTSQVSTAFHPLQSSTLLWVSSSTSF